MSVSRWYMHVTIEGYLDGIMPGFLEDGETPNVNDADLENGWQPWPFDREPPEDLSEYRIENGELVHDPPPPTEEEMEAIARAEVIDGLPQYVADTDAALCELYEMQEQALADTDAALCEIYEMLIGE